MLVAVELSIIQGVSIHSDTKSSRVIEQLAVRPGNQGRGIGSALIEWIERDAKSAGVRALELDTAEIMTDLLRLYGRYDFEVDRKDSPKHGRDSYLRVFMRKTI